MQFKLPSNARLGLLGAGGLIGWLSHLFHVDGTSSGTTAAMVASALVAAFSLFGDFGALWKAAGGKVDGKLTDAEAKALNEGIIRKINPSAADFIGSHIGEATSLANWLFQYSNKTFTVANETVNDDQEHIQLMLAAHQALSREVAGNTEGETAALNILKVLQDQWNKRPAQVPGIQRRTSEMSIPA